MGVWMRRWTLKGKKRDVEKNKNRMRQFIREYRCGTLLSALLAVRGYDAEDVEALLDEALLFDDPFTLKDMDLAVDRINRAVDEGEHIVVYGDYDCDGVTASALLFTFLQGLGAEVEIRLPDRLKDGYGLHVPAVKKMAQDGVDLIITVDNGIAAIEEAELIAELGMDLVVTDHHLPGERLPKAAAVVDPHRADCESRFKDLAGVGVALKLVAAMQDGDYVTALESFGAIAAIGTVGDMMPIVDENRSIVRFGFQMLKNADFPGLQALLSAAGVKPGRISTRDAAFSLVPRINAAGRVGDPMDAVNLLLCEDGYQATQLAGKLNSLNAARQQLEQQIMEDIALTTAKDPTITLERVIVVSGENWHPGVIGICAAKLLERYGKPAFVLTVDSKTGTAHGSARGVEGFSVYDALSGTSDALTAFGGHEGAGGFSLAKEEIPRWKEQLYGYCRARFPIMPTCTVFADLAVTPSTLSIAAVEELRRLEPFGTGNGGDSNQPPVFMMRGCTLIDKIPLSGGKHTKFKVECAGERAEILLFGAQTDDICFESGAQLDFLVEPQVSVYQEEKQLSLRCVDYRSSLIVQDKFFSAKAYYEMYCRGEQISDRRLLLHMGPTRSEVGAVYKRLMSREVWGGGIEMIYPAVVLPEKMNYCKFRLCVDILSELGFVSTDASERLICHPGKEKVRLTDSKAYAYFEALREGQAVR